MKNFVSGLFLCLLLMTVAMPATAQSKYGNSFTADQARDARQQGMTVPLRDIFRRLKSQHGGHQIDANLYNRDRGQVYVIDWMTEKGERIQITVDAKTGRTVSSS